MGWWNAQNQLYALNYLIGNGGLSPYGAAGLVSRWANVESTAQGPFSQGGYLGRAFGIAQWLGPRLPPIQGNTSFDAQLAYVLQELGSSERRAGSLLSSAQSVDDGARGATAYERAAGWNAATNTDNYTARTAAGIPAVLALLGSQAGPGDNSSSGGGSVTTIDNSSVVDDGSGGGSFNVSGLILLGIGALILYEVIS